MNNKSEISTPGHLLTDAFGWLFGSLVFLIGLINIFWGNDQGYGIFIILLSLAFFPPSSAFFKRISGIKIPTVLKILLALFIIWSAMGVAELPDKINLMKTDLGI